MIKKETKRRILEVVNVFETGSREGDYSNVTLYNDGPNNIKQITYGRAQTTEYSNLKKLLQMYVEAKGSKYSKSITPYVEKIGKQHLADDKPFITLLRRAGSDPVMVEVQDQFFDLVYWNPAYRFFVDNSFRENLTMLVIYDSWIHGGLNIVRKKFGQRPPNAGGKEKLWTTAYISARDSWLRYHPKQILHRTVYRTRALMKAATQNNWDLEKPIDANGILV